jgi:hypothetical protein
MPINELKFIKTSEGYFLGVSPNIAGQHMRLVLDEYGHSRFLSKVKTEEIPTNLLLQIIKERPWVREKIVERLKKVGATDKLKELGVNDGE